VLHDLIVFGGLTVSIIVVALIAKSAHKAVMAAVAETSAPSAGIDQ
jgi:hypothetical protein